jgi:hypothetical protein
MYRVTLFWFYVGLDIFDGDGVAGWDVFIVFK